LSRGADTGEDVVAPVAELSRNIGSAATAVTGQLQARADEGRQKRAAQAQTVARDAAPAVAASKAPQAPAGKTTPQETVAAAAAAKPVASRESAAIQALYEERKRAGQALLERAAQVRAVEAKAQPPAAEVPPPVREEPVDVEEVLRRAQQDVANASLVEHPAPFLVNLSQQTKNAIPTILYQRHDYDSQAGRGSVTLNGKTVRVGGTPMPGVKVDEILEDSVILSYRGTQFRLRALNSWVNL